jgi:hypothetical protein
MDVLFFLAKVLLNIIVVYILSYYIFLKYNSAKKFFFTYNMMGLTTFLLCYLLSSVSLELGFSLGLFAILAIIRFRTVNIPIKQMTYLFIIIGVSVINSLVSNNNIIMLLIANLIVILFLLFIENKLSSLRNEKD